jgi:hypothetical protein
VFFLKPGESELIHIYRAELMDVNFVSLSWWIDPLKKCQISQGTLW